MSIINNQIALMVMGGLVIFTGCETTDDPSKDEIRSALEAIISDDEALGMDEFNDGGALDIEFGDITDGALGKTLEDYYPSDSLRFRFGRNVTDHEISVTHEFEGDSVVYSTISHTISGDFITVIFDTSGVLVDSFAKPFNIEAIRKVKFKKIDNTRQSRRNWRLIALTPIVSIAGSKIDIDSLVITKTLNGDFLYRFEAENLLDLYIDRENMTQFTTGTFITLKLYVSNTGPEYVWESGEGAHLRIGRGRRSLNGQLHARRKFFDDGDETHGDEVANDNEFTRIFFVHTPGMGFERRIFKMFVDVIDFETLFSTEGEYNAALWGFPYIAKR